MSVRIPIGDNLNVDVSLLYDQDGEILDAEFENSATGKPVEFYPETQVIEDYLIHSAYEQEAELGLIPLVSSGGGDAEVYQDISVFGKPGER